MAKVYEMSQETFDAKVKRLDYLQTVRVKEVAELIKEARSYGDLSENSEYDEAKNEQGKVYSEIAELKDQINHARILEKTGHSDLVGVSTVLTVLDLEYNEEEVYQVVGSQDANPTEGKISVDSPLGRALMGHHTGDIVTVEAPAGELQFKIVKIND